jgi:adenylosuccinate synthase
VLDGLETIKACTAYEYRGKGRELAPLDADGWDECKPVYLEFPGWEESTAGIRDWNKLPPATCAYLRAMEEPSGCKLALVATGAGRRDPRRTDGWRCKSQVNLACSHAMPN